MRNPFWRSIAIGAGVTVGAFAVVALVFIAISNYGGSNGSTSVKAQEAPACPDSDHEMAKGEYYQAHAGCSIAGDVQVGTTKDDLQPYYPNPNSGSRGNVVTCVKDCYVFAPFGGADVSPRSPLSLAGDEVTSGCGSKCADVQFWTAPDHTAVKVVTASDLSDAGKSGATPTTAPAATPTPGAKVTQPLNDSCEPELKLGDKRVVKKGCIVVGDVLVRPAGSSQDFHPVYDNRQKTGTVQQLTEDTEVWNVQGASVMPQDSDLASTVTATKMGGCGTGYGCPDGIYDWSGKRLDQ